ncbi:hypothetical protein NPIL_103121 [Nephila pilipes]|uniref:RNase H type-1 domain-containing protein n=1 Tax=Nephila pilipes TaxID=299642 RepID=A0A8X6TQ49_NEPPI|nr:hypothetical protein NPIL_103121 [Nephila pilipes]
MREKYKTIALQWIPSHIVIPGNEKAHGLAKRRLVNQGPYDLVSYKSTSSLINQTLKTTHMSSLKEWKKENRREITPINLPNWPRSIAVAAIRLTTEHDCLYAHHCRFWIVDSPACSLCCSGGAMNVDHLPVCSALTKNCIYSRY